ncbi:MAG: hypothetical protein WC223_13145 [Bacteroidales bacterium]|jgi:hypothetical protein
MKTHLPENKIRTSQQNKALHKYCELLSGCLVEAGITQKVLFEGLEVETSPEAVKMLFRAIGKARYGKESTAKFTTKEMTSIFDEVNLHISKWGIYVKWPSTEPEYGDNY